MCSSEREKSRIHLILVPPLPLTANMTPEQVTDISGFQFLHIKMRHHKNITLCRVMDNVDCYGDHFCNKYKYQTMTLYTYK